MRRTNFLKVVSIMMVVAMMLCNTIGVYAADEVQAVQNPADTSVTVSGSIDGALPYEDNVTVILLHSSVTDPQTYLNSIITGTTGSLDMTKVLGMGQATVDENGEFLCEITIPDDASNAAGSDYKAVVFAPPLATPLATPFRFVPSDEKVALLKAMLQETSRDALVTMIETDKITFGVDTNTMWDDIADGAPVIGTGYQKAVADALINTNEIFKSLRANISSVTLADVEKAVKAIAQEAYAQAVANSSRILVAVPSSSPVPLVSNLDNIADYDYVADFVNVYKNKYLPSPLPGGFVDKVTTSVIDQGAADYKDMITEYKKQVILNAVVTPRNGNGIFSREALDVLAGSAGLDATSANKYMLLDSSARQMVADICKASNATTFTALNTAFIDAVSAQATASPTPTPTPGPGNGGGGGGGIVVVQPTPTASSKPINERYNDIDDVEWAWEAIEELSDKGIVSGYENGSFAPHNSILREEFIKLAVVGLLGAEAIDPSAAPSFADAQSGWYAPYIAAAENNSITSGIGNGLFGTGNEITRQDIALMLYRMLRDAGVAPEIKEYAFTDANDIATYASEAVYALKNIGIINGDPDGSFRPQGRTTRAEAVVLLYKTLDKLGKILH